MDKLISKMFVINRKYFKSITDKLMGILINSYKIQRGDLIYYENYNYWQKMGFHIIPNHYYHPIPDTSLLNRKTFEAKKMIGVKMNDAAQLNMLKKLSKYNNEFKQFKKIDTNINVQLDCNYYFNNMAFDGVDALLYYAMIRYLDPKTVIEIGSGWSTKIAAKACLKNINTKLISIEPYPQPILLKGFPGLSTLIKKKIEDIPLDYFQKLKSGDILFIDSSHNIKVGGDVNYIFLEILPRLKKGVYIHIHDIFFPNDYPKQWILNERRFWTEQYLLHAFLLFNDSFKIAYSNSYMSYSHLSQVKKGFRSSPTFGGGSIWLKRI
jgi:hypothetical protein